MTDSLQFLRIEPAESSLMIRCEATEVPHQIDMAAWKDEITRQLEKHQSEEVVFDLGEVKILSSRFLALMAAVQQMPVPVWVESPSPEIVKLLELTRYDQVIKVRHSVV